MVILARHLCKIFIQPVRTIHSNNNIDKKLSVLFFGTDSFSIPTLTRLHEEYVKNGCISHIESCCPPMKHLVCRTKEVSEILSINLHPWPPDPDICKQFDLGIVASFGHMIPSRIITSFKLGMLNVHGSVLPRYRGAAPIQHAILNGETNTGVTIMEVKPFQGPDTTFSKLEFATDKDPSLRLEKELRMCKEDREFKEKLLKLKDDRKIESFRISWMSGKFVVRREKFQKSIHNKDDIEQFEKMEPMKENQQSSSFQADEYSYDM